MLSAHLPCYTGLGFCKAGVANLHELTTPAYFITGGIAHSASRRYLVYSEADFEVYVAPMGVKFGMEEGLKVSSKPNFTPIGATTRVQDPKN